MFEWFKRRQKEAHYIYENDPACNSIFEAWFFYPNQAVLRKHRKAHNHYKKGRNLWARWISERSKRKSGIEIHPGARIGEFVFIDHGVGLVIGETAVVGDRVTLFHGVTLGGTGKEKNEKRHPTIGHDAIIGTGATILGNITVGHHAKIGAGSVVLKDVPPYATAVGVPARVIINNENGDHITELKD